LHLSPEEIAAAEACGISFLPATDAQVQRLAMQRKVFYRNGAPILASRGNGLFETVGTLQPLIEEGLQQQRDLAQWLVAAPAAEPEAVTPAAQPAAYPAAAPVMQAPVVAGEAPEDVPGDTPEPLPEAMPEERPAKRPRQRRVRAAFEPWVAAVAEAEAPPAAAPAAPRLAAAPRMAAPVLDAVAEERGKRWVVAGAARRGRAGKHWSTRQRG
jgi:hypothetical protein